MSKIGRNDPCPCGSGKKYKKCCLGKEIRPEGAARVAMSGSRTSSTKGSADATSRPAPLMTPYTAAKLFEESEIHARMTRVEPERARLFWTPGKIAKLSTEDIVALLEGLGVDASRGVYLGLAKGRTSAWPIGDLWRVAIATELSPHDEDFLGLAACELWKRYCPEIPSMEMLDDWMQEGYAHTMEGEGARACERWQNVWEHIRLRLRSEMRTLEATHSVFNGLQALFNWVQDFALELHNAALREPRLAEKGVQLCQEVLTQFPDESEQLRMSFRADLGEFHYMLGEDEQGEAVLLDLIRDYPDQACGYVQLADILGFGLGGARGPIDIPRAIELLDQALAKPVIDAEQYDLGQRRRDLQHRVSHGNGGANTCEARL